MTKIIEIDWSKGVRVGSEFFPEDKLERAKYAKFLTGFLAEQGFDGVQKSNYVLNLNSEWGAGKTYFLKRWAKDLQPHYPVAYIDAWKQDYSDDPLMTVVSSLIKQFRLQAGKGEDDPIFKAPRKLIGLLKAAAPGIARGLTKRYLGIDPVEIMNAEDDDELPGGGCVDADGEPIPMGFAASGLVKHLIDEHDAKSVAIESLKKSVQEWVEAVIDPAKVSYPAFIFIDELDRCRPSYAVEMLETIKHIFDIEGVVFVVATDTEQLQHAVKAVYGEGFDARVYLGRFFNSRYTLRKPSYEKLLEVHCDLDKLSPDYLASKQIVPFPSSLDVQDIRIKNLTVVYDSFGLPARQVIQITDRLIAAVESLSDIKCLNIIYLAFLLSLREKAPHLYEVMTTYQLGRKLDSDSSLTLEMAIIRIGNLDNQFIKFECNPVSILPTLTASNSSTYTNNWPNGLYECTLRKYIQEIHMHMLHSYNDSNWRGKMREVADMQHSGQIGPDKGGHWASIGFATQNENSGLDIGFYKDLVELASAIDWLDE